MNQPFIKFDLGRHYITNNMVSQKKLYLTCFELAG